MERRKKIYGRSFLTMVTVLALVTAMLTPFPGKVSKAADFNARVLPLNGMWSSDYYLTETNKEQYYQITIPSDGKFNLRAMSYFGGYGSNWDLNWKLYNNDLSRCLAEDWVSGSETSPETKSTTWVLSAGTYYCKIYSGNTGKYKLCGLFSSYGVNDQSAVSFDSPLTYQLGDTIIGALTETDREDWYKMVILSSGYYTQKMVTYFGGYGSNWDLNWKLYNSDLSKCLAEDWVSGSETSPKAQKIDVFLSKGTYYVKIYSGNTGKYNFQCTKLTQSTCSHDYEKTWHDTTYFNRGYNYYHCKKCGHSYKGDYEPVKKLGQAYVYLYSSSAGKKKIKLSWGMVSDASGYQIQYSKKSNMKDNKTVIVKGRSKTTKTIKKLSRHKRYYFKVRAYKKSGSKKVYGKWSQKKCFKTR